MKVNKISIKKVVTLLIITSPILNIYKIGSLPLGGGDFALCLAILIFFFIDKPQKLSIKIHSYNVFVMFLLFFLMSIMAIFVQGNFNISDFVSKWSRIIVYGITLLIVFIGGINLDYAKKYCVGLSIIFSLTVILQELLKLIGINVFPYLNILPLNYNVTNLELINVLNKRASFGGWRVSSIFPEPAHFTQYVLMGLAIVLFDKYEKNNMNNYLAKSIIITIAIIISASTNGYVIGLCIWGVWFLNIYRKKLTIRTVLISTLFMSIVLILFFKTNALNNALYRLSTINSFSEGATGSVRLLQGLYVFKQLSLREMLMGVGFGNVSYYLAINSITTPFLSEIGNEYMNAFSTVLVSSGIIGYILFMCSWIKLSFTRKTALSKVSMLILTLLYCSSSIFYSSTTILFLTFALSESQNDNLKTCFNKLIWEKK